MLFSDCTCLMFLILQSQPFILETLPIHYQCCSTCISVLFLLLSFSYFCNSSPGLFPLLFYLISCVFSELYLILKRSLNTFFFLYHFLSLSAFIFYRFFAILLNYYTPLNSSSLLTILALAVHQKCIHNDWPSSVQQDQENKIWRFWSRSRLCPFCFFCISI